MKEKTKVPFGVKDEIGYVCGDMAGSFVNLYVDAYFLTFCTYVLGVNAVWMGTLFLASRLWDAVNDPLIGSLPDRFRLGKSGDKFKPYIKIAMIPLALSGILCFTSVPFEGVMLHAWIAIVYVLYGMSYTGTSMPFGAMASVVTDDAINRTKLSRARSIGGTIVGICALSFVPVICFDSDSNILPERFTMLAVIFGVLSIVCYLLLMKLTQERVVVPHKGKAEFNYGEVVKQAFMNRPLVGVMVATIGSMLYITGNSQLTTYIYKEYYGNTAVMTIVSLASIPLMFIAFPLIPRLVKKYGKRTVILFSVVTGLIVSMIPILIRIENVYVYSGIRLLGSVFQTAFMMLIWAMVTDCLDYAEYLFHSRNDGSNYSLYTFSRKIGSTIASTVASFSLAAIGYVSGTNVVQSAEAVVGIYYLVSMIPVACCLLQCIGIGFIFNLDKTKTDEMYAELAQRKQATAE